MTLKSLRDNGPELYRKAARRGRAAPLARALAATLVSLFACTGAFAAYEGGERMVTALHVDGGRIYVMLDPAPDVCQGGAYYGWGHLRLTLTQNNADQLYAMLLSAYHSNEPIAGVWYNGTSCSNSGVPDITALGVRK